MMPDTMQQLTLSNVSLSFAGSPILEGIDLQLASDELVVVVGASGSGKTSMLRLAAGFQLADSGTVQMNGHDIAGPGA